VNVCYIILPWYNKLSNNKLLTIRYTTLTKVEGGVFNKINIFMEDQIKKFISDIKSKKLSAISEDATKNSIILRLLNILGWDIFDNYEVYPEYVTGGRRVDYSLRYYSKNKVFIEVKKIDENLEIHQEQLLTYAFHEGIELAILTNGLSWWFYLPLNPGSWQERKFFSIDIFQQKEMEITSNFINFLAKDNVISEKAIETAKTLYKSNQKDHTIALSLPKAWNNLIQETDKSLIELINDTNEKLCGYRASDEKIVEFLNDNNSQLLLSGVKKYIENTNAEKSLPTNIKSAREYISVLYTGKKPRCFYINNKKIEVRSWKDILIETCSYLFDEYKSEFEQKTSSVRWKKGVYFSRNKDLLINPKQISNSGLYVEACLNANSIVKFSEDLVALFGYDRDLRIDCE